MMEAFVDWSSKDQICQSSIRSSPRKICEPINLAATESPALIQAAIVFVKSFDTDGDCSDDHGVIWKERAFLLGDATGVSKVALHNELTLEYTTAFPTSRVVWISANSRLETEARRELEIVVQTRCVSFSASLLCKCTTWEDPIVDSRQSLHAAVVLGQYALLRNPKSVGTQVIDDVLKTCRHNVVYSSATPFGRRNTSLTSDE